MRGGAAHSGGPRGERRQRRRGWGGGALGSKIRVRKIYWIGAHTMPVQPNQSAGVLGLPRHNHEYVPRRVGQSSMIFFGTLAEIYVPQAHI